jgi:actin-related protein
VGLYSPQAGFAGDDALRTVFDSVVGCSRKSDLMEAMENMDTYVGYDL